MERFSKPVPMGTTTQVAIARHPMHPMLVTFPIAFFIGALGTDWTYWFLGDPFWARASTWLLGMGTLMGALAGLAGTVELLAVAGIRRRAAGWSHFVVAVMLLAVEFINWLARIRPPMHQVDASALYLSTLGAALVAAAGWFGGKLVFEHQVGIHDDEQDPPIQQRV
jgi:Predicted membrane protein